MLTRGVAVVLVVLLARWVAVALHELAHAISALALGYRPRVSLSPFCGISSTVVVGVHEQSFLASAVIRHAGWATSVGIAVAASWYGLANLVTGTLWLTAFDGVLSDLVCHGGGDRFCCGNFGLLLLDATKVWHLRCPIR